MDRSVNEVSVVVPSNRGIVLSFVSLKYSASLVVLVFFRINCVIFICVSFLGFNPSFLMCFLFVCIVSFLRWAQTPGASFGTLKWSLFLLLHRALSGEKTEVDWCLFSETVGPSKPPEKRAPSKKWHPGNNICAPGIHAHQCCGHSLGSGFNSPTFTSGVFLWRVPG